MNFLYKYYESGAGLSNNSIELSNSVFLTICLISIIMYLLCTVSLWKIFKKAGQPGWAAIIPIYNLVIIIKIAKLSTWKVILFFIPIINIYILIKFAKVFGKSTGFGFILSIFPYIFIPILAFSKCEYTKENIENNTSSILDVQNVGVPNNSESTDFSYGYEKEPTIIMDPINSKVIPESNIMPTEQPIETSQQTMPTEELSFQNQSLNTMNSNSSDSNTNDALSEKESINSMNFGDTNVIPESNMMSTEQSMETSQETIPTEESLIQNPVVNIVNSNSSDLNTNDALSEKESINSMNFGDTNVISENNMMSTEQSMETSQETIPTEEDDFEEI